MDNPCSWPTRKKNPCSQLLRISNFFKEGLIFRSSAQLFAYYCWNLVVCSCWIEWDFITNKLVCTAIFLFTPHSNSAWDLTTWNIYWYWSISGQIILDYPLYKNEYYQLMCATYNVHRDGIYKNRFMLNSKLHIRHF